MNFNRIMDEIFREECSINENDTIYDDMTAAQVNGWDSLANMQLITRFEDEFSITFSFDELLNIQTWGDFKSVVTKKISSRN